MVRQPLATFLGTLSLFLGCLFGCSPAPLAHPAIIGASASAGFGCEVTGPDGKPYLVDMEAVYQSLVPGWHSDPIFLADASFYSRSRQSAVEQMDAALAQNPSIIIAADYLFWSVYASRGTITKPDDIERDRHDALEQALAQLDRFQGPIIIGDLPDMHAAVGRMLSEQNMPPQQQLEAFNRRIAAWAEHRRTHAPVVVLPIAALDRSVEAGLPVPTSYETFSATDAAALLQPDHLHPTPAGLVVILREGLAGLAAQGVIKPDAFRADLKEAVSRLPAEALAVDSRREPGLWTLMAIKGRLDDFGDALSKKDCTKAAELFDQIMEKTSRLKRSPHEYAGIFVAFTLTNYRVTCADAPPVIRRWRDRLAPAIERPLPDPWPLTLWSAFNESLDEEPRNVERALRLQHDNPSLDKEYRSFMYDAAESARFTDPTAYLTLISDWHEEEARQSKRAKDTADFWTARSKRDDWPKEVERNYNMALQFAADDETRSKITAHHDDYTDPHRTIVLAREMTIDRLVVLERALTLTGHTEDAAALHARLDQLVGQDEIAPARERVEKAAAEAAAPKKAKGS